jgi:hypothetical protein
VKKRITLTLVFSLAFFPINFLTAAEDILPLLKFYLNAQPAVVTVQDLSGLATRPLRLLIKRNNQARDREFVQAYAMGVREGDDLTMELTMATMGVRATIYKIVREKGGPRYLSMPASVYFTDSANVNVYKERIEPFEEECFIIIFEKTGSAEEKNIQIRYFEERVRNLVIASYKTNLLLSSLKFKLKDYAGGETTKFFERDAQLLINRLNNPQQILLIRLWRVTDK